MICTNCRSSETRVKETRKSGFVIRRRHACLACKHVYSTVERPSSSIGETRQLRSRNARATILRLADEGWKRLAIASEVGLSEAHVNKVVRSARGVERKELAGRHLQGDAVGDRAGEPEPAALRYRQVGT